MPLGKFNSIRRLSIMTILFSSHAYSNERVVLLHGLARSEHSMTKLQKKRCFNESVILAKTGKRQIH